MSQQRRPVRGRAVFDMLALLALLLAVGSVSVVVPPLPRAGRSRGAFPSAHLESISGHIAVASVPRAGTNLAP